MPGGQGVLAFNLDFLAQEARGGFIEFCKWTDRGVVLLMEKGVYLTLNYDLKWFYTWSLSCHKAQCLFWVFFFFFQVEYNCFTRLH